MKTTKITLFLILFFAVGNIADAGAQSWLERLGKRAEETAKRKVERKVEDKVDKAVDNVFDKAEEKAKQKKSGSSATLVEPPETGTPALNPRDWDDGEPYHALKKGTQIVYTLYDGKGKVQGYNQQEIIDITRTKNSVNAVVSGSQTNSKGKVENSASVSLRYHNGNFHVDLLSIMLPKDMQGIDVDAKVSGQDMLIPGKLTPGQTLPDATATFKMKVKSSEGAFDVPSLTFRVFNRRAIQAESVDTPMGKFICFKITQTVEADYPIIGVQRGTSITWIGKGMGVVKTEHYDAKGKLTSRMLLTKLQ